LYIEGRGALKRELVAALRTGRALRKPRARAQRGSKPHGHVTEDVMISQRPAEAKDRAVPGHWEGDLIIARRTLSHRYCRRATQPQHLAGSPTQIARVGRGAAGQEWASAGRLRRGSDECGPASFDDPPAVTVAPHPYLGSG